MLVPDLRRFLETKLPEYMVPSAFVVLPAMPRTPNGKLDRRQLPVPDRVRAVRHDTYVMPRTPTEQRLAAMWTETLGVEPIGVYDNFFDLGGHSLLAIRLLSRMRDAFKQDIPLRAIFEQPTIAELAQVAERAQTAEDRPRIVALSRDTRAATLLPNGALQPGRLDRH
jgi:hypothetical protein